jgi:hypothetical protein
VEEVVEIKILDRGGVRVTFDGPNTAEHLVRNRKFVLEGINNRSQKPLKDHIICKWSWSKRARLAAGGNNRENGIYLYIDPRDFMTGGVTGTSGDEVDIQNGLLSFLKLPHGATCQLFKRPACFYVYFETAEQRDEILEIGNVKTKPELMVRGVYKVGKRQERPREYDNTLPPWSGLKQNNRVETDTANNEVQHAVSDNFKKRDDIDTETNSTSNTSVTTASNSMNSDVYTRNDDEKFKQTKSNAVEATLHKFVSDQEAQQKQQLAVRQLETDRHERRMELMENMLLKIAEKIVTT